jgi:hypothetical protein
MHIDCSQVFYLFTLDGTTERDFYTQTVQAVSQAASRAAGRKGLSLETV